MYGLISDLAIEPHAAELAVAQDAPQFAFGGRWRLFREIAASGGSGRRS